MISRMRPGALRRRAGFVVIVACLISGVSIAGGQMPAPAIPQTRAGSAPPTADETRSPQYPAEALKKGEQGVVMLDVTVNSTGKITEITVDKSKTTAPPVLQTAALRTAGTWTFIPGAQDGHPVGGRLQVPVTFSLDPSPCQVSRAGRIKNVDGKQYFSCVDGHRDSQSHTSDKSS